ncbi:MAG TPA: ABC transporter ATP-binding protein/permease [Candidatus Baltobacterales bacterium]|nr:ABC transporter ATP-binding protein/permease [Candidatus Baltobacterales bacterium]
MATLVEDENRESNGSQKGRRRRLRRKADAGLNPPADANGSDGARSDRNGAVAVAPEREPASSPAVPEPAPASSELPRGRRQTLRRKTDAVLSPPADADRPDGIESHGNGALAVPPGPEPASPPEPSLAAVVAAASPAPPDEFNDLLGQAAGLRLDGVSREFGGKDEMHVTALRNVTLEIGPGEFVSVMGPSGCGKSTLLALMGGLDHPTSGHVYGAGLPLGELPERALADYRLQRVSTIFQTFNLIPSMSLEDNVALPLTIAGIPVEERLGRARHLLALVGLEDRARTRVSRLSGGEQQKVAVARALANRPGLILADEPTGSLDSKSGEGVLSLLEDLNRRGATVVLVTHDPEVARRARRVVRMIDGRAIELEAGKPTMRTQEPLDPAPRMHWRDTLKVGLGSAGRRPLRTALTTTGVAIGIAALSLIVALAGGLQQALSAPALATSQVHQVAVYPVADTVNGFDDPTLATLAGLAHVRAAWGQLGMTGTFGGAAPSAGATSAPVAAPTGALVSLPPLHSSSALPTLIAGRLPSSDNASEVVLSDSEAAALGFQSPPAAIGTQVTFNATYGTLASAGARNPATHAVAQRLLVVGIVSGNYMPAGGPGGLAPYSLMRGYWTRVAQANGWKRGEYSSVTLLADSGLSVDSLRKNVEALGFQDQTFGDQFRNLEDLLGKMRVALLGLALVALLLACLGIANTMYTAVLERTKEIGVLKALGARSRDVLLLFVAEAAGIGLAGGLIGALVAVGLGRLGNAAVDRLTQAVSSTGFEVFRTDFGVVLLAVVLAVLLSTVTGLLPALRAARQDPAHALHYE